MRKFTNQADIDGGWYTLEEILRTEDLGRYTLESFQTIYGYYLHCGNLRQTRFIGGTHPWDICAVGITPENELAMLKYFKANIYKSGDPYS